MENVSSLTRRLASSVTAAEFRSSGVETLQFRFGQFDQPRQALAMFCREILSFMKSPAMLAYSALALNQEGLDAKGPLNHGRLRREDAGQCV